MRGKKKTKKKEAERSLQAVKCSQPQYIAYGLTWSCLTQHWRCTAKRLQRREPLRYSSSAGNVHVFYSCLSAHFTSSPIQKHFIKSVCLLPNSQRYRPPSSALARRVYGKNGQSGLTALLGTPWSVPFQ